jgi:hypothetical protein
MTEETISTSEALAALRGLSDTHYREDTVWVDCQSAGERSSVANAASAALTKGYVHKVVSSKDLVDLRVYIQFKKPVWKT